MAQGPLLSWDIFMAGYHKVTSRIEDLQQLKKMSRHHQWVVEWDLEEMLLRRGKVIIVTDPLLSICFASSSLIYMNGYQPEEVTGKSPGMFQGADTSNETRMVIHQAVSEWQPFDVSILNYRKDGTSYWCDIKAFPVLNKRQKRSHFIAFEEIVDE